MHIPDGYLSPQTCAVTYVAMAPFWAYALARLKKTLRMRQVPLLALAAAFSFVIMMFNIPAGPTTGHAVGAVLIAILLGPWEALIAVSLALILQALLHGDGGITAIAANCINIGLVMSFAGWWVYKLIAGKAPANSARHWLGAAVGGYVGINAAALATAITIGLQPLIATDAAGRALYSPFGLQLAVPVMTLEHLLVFGFVEAIVTGLVVAAFQRSAPEMIVPTAAEPQVRMPVIHRAAVVLGLLILLTPLGLYLPQAFKAGGAWGEWSSDEVAVEMTRHAPGTPGYVPQGMARLEKTWHALLPDYAFPGQDAAATHAQALPYIFCGALGAGILVLLVLGLRRVIARKDSDGRSSGVDVPVPHQ